MSSAPKRPTVDYIDTEDGAVAIYDERLTSEYMDHLEQRVRELEAENGRLRQQVAELCGYDSVEEMEAIP